jgi:hypothetical protein
MDRKRTEKEFSGGFRGDPMVLQSGDGQGVCASGANLRARAEPVREPNRDPLSEHPRHPRGFANESRTQQEALETLLRKSSEAFMKVLRSPYDEHHRKVQEARADLEEASPS